MKCLTVLSLILFPLQGLAQERQSTPRRDTLVRQNIEVSKRVDSFAQRIDLFLTGEKVTGRENESTLVLSNRLDWKEGGEVEYKPHFDVDLRLPNLEKKWKLKLSSYDNSEVGSGVDRSRVDAQSAGENYGTSIEFVEDLQKYKVSFRPRLQLSPTLGMSYLLRFRREIKLSNTSQFRPTYTLFARPEDGTGVFISYNTSIQSGKQSLIKWINEGEYTNKENIFKTNNGLSHSRPLRWRHTNLVHSLVFESINRPSFHLERIVLSSGFYHKAMYRVFHYAITPYVAFAKEDNFKGKFGMRFDLNFIF